jgi:DNA topoisomerase-1
VSWDRPFVEECPQCHAPFLVKKETKRGATIRCLTKDCGYLRREGEAEEQPVDADAAGA